MRYLFKILLYAAVCVAGISTAQAAGRALVVVGLTGGAASEEELTGLAGATKKALISRGFPADNIQVLVPEAGNKKAVSRETVLTKLAEAKDLGADDEYWLVLFGITGRAQDGGPAFQVIGPRLTAADFKGVLDAIPAQQYVFIGTNSSGGYLPLLQGPGRTVLSATLAEGEVYFPRFPAAWVEVLKQNPRAGFIQIAARAAEQTNQEYASLSLAQGEHARLVGPGSKAILEPPFGADRLADLGAKPAVTPVVPAPPVRPEDIKTGTTNSTVPWEARAATDETRRMIEEGRKSGANTRYPAVILEQRISFSVEEDRTTERMGYFRTFVARDDAIQDWGTFFFPQNPPTVTTRVLVARVILPDGSSQVFNPAAFTAAKKSSESGPGGQTMVHLPAVRSGCVVEISYRTRSMLEATLPEVSEVIPVQREVPVLVTSVEARTPKRRQVRFLMQNANAAPQESEEGSWRVVRWQLPELAALEMLPGDPPASNWAVTLKASSLVSWKSFTEWYRRLAKDSDVIDPTVRETATNLAKGLSGRMDKIQRMFEFVSAFRYVPIEMGVQGFRPRTPATVLENRYGDCKDKANLLVALLRCNGIDADLALVNRFSTTDVNFPSWQFNHAICFVPKNPEAGQKEDLWFDSTDTITPFGYISPGDYGRPALVISGTTGEFKNVVSEKPVVSMGEEEWKLVQSSDGEWKGTYEHRANGLAEYDLRRRFRGLGPARLEVAVTAWLDELARGVSVSDLHCTDMASLHERPVVRAGVLLSGAGLPGVNFPWSQELQSAARNRPLLLNDGQPFSGKQSVHLKYAQAPAAALPAPFRTEGAGAKFSVEWSKGADQTIVRTAAYQLPAGSISAAGYPALRKAFREWAAIVCW